MSVQTLPFTLPATTGAATGRVPLRVRHGASCASDPRKAVSAVRDLIHQDDAQLILFFCDPAYDLPLLAGELRAAFGSIPVVGCTTAGCVGLEGYTTGGLRAVSVAGEITAYPSLIDLGTGTEAAVTRIAEDAARIISDNPDESRFALLLVDGVSLKEEELVSLLFRKLPRVPVTGGSASDGMRLEKTHVYSEGAFHSNAAIFTLFTTRLPFVTMKFTHFLSAEDTLVVTASDPGKRIVHEFNGEPAAPAYASCLGVPVEKLDSGIFAARPLLFEMNGEQYIRSVANVNPDQSLTLFCAIEDGMILSTGRSVNPPVMARAAFQRVQQEIGEPALVIGCDCVLRRLEFEAHGLLRAMGDIMKSNKVFGFSTYGEQCDGLHMNQTFTGIAIGSEYAPG